MKKSILGWLFLLVCLPGVAPLKLGASADDLLEPEKAFRFSARVLDAATLEVRFDARGQEIKGLRVIGYQNAERFQKTLSLATSP